MDKSLRLQKLKKNRLGFVGYQVLEKKAILSSLGVPILLEGQGGFVCGGCYLLLRSMGVRYSSHLPLTDLPQMSSLRPLLSLTSRDGCRVHFLSQPPSLFPNCRHEDGYISTVCYLECRKTGEIIKKVQVPPLSMGEREKRDFFKNYGAMVSLILDKLTALPDWRVTYQNMS